MKRQMYIIFVVVFFLSHSIFADDDNNCCLNDECCDTKRYHSFMSPRPANQNLAVMQGEWHDHIYSKNGCLKGSLQLIGYFQKSIESSHSNKYFLFHCKQTLHVAGDDAIATPADRDVRAEWVNLPSTFSGDLSAFTHQRQYCITAQYNQSIGDFFDFDFLKDYWVDCAASFIMVKNNLGAVQSNQTPLPPTDTPHDLLSAFSQSSWMYAKFDGERTQKRLAEIAIRFGKAFMDEDDFQIAYYSGLRIPTGNKQNAEFVFEPVAGNNGHWGFITGVNFQIVANRDNSIFTTCLFLDIENTYFARNHQYRTIDLKGKPWSRYLLLNKQYDGPNQNIPAVNVLTQKVEVHAWNSIDVSVGVRLKTCSTEWEVGYSMWGHGHEKIELHHCFPEIYGIMGARDMAHPNFATTASRSNITNQSANDVDADGAPVFVPIRRHDLDLRSAAAKGVLTHRVHGSFGCSRDGTYFDTFANIGGFFEIPNKDGGALRLWGLWGKFGGSF